MRSSKTIRGILPLVIGGLLLVGSVDVAWGQPCEATEFAQLLGSEAQEGDWFGSSVAIDGDTAVIGAFGDAGFTGAAYVFRFEGSSWVQEAKLTASDGKETDEFSGYGIAIGGDWIVIGACQTDDVEPENPMCESGSVYMFKRPPTGWEDTTETLKLAASDAACGAYFGFTVAIEGDTTVVSAKGDEGGTGAVYVFERDEGGPDNWGQVAKLTASDADDNYGLAESVSISGGTIVAGTPDPCPGETCGVAYIFEEPPNGWTDMTETIKLDFPPGADGVGYVVSISGDVAMVGAPWEPVEVGYGAVYVFERDEGGPDNWGQAAKLIASDSDPNDVFGESLSLDGDMAVIASPWDIVGGYMAGSVYVFQFDGTDWIEEAKLTPSDVEEDLQEEAFVAMSGGTAVFGRPIEEGDPRPAYVYTYLSDCDSSGTLDACEIEDGTLHDDDDNGIPDECECPGDIDGDGDTDQSDLGELLSAWCSLEGDPNWNPSADLDGDGHVGHGDLGILLADWGCSASP